MKRKELKDTQKDSSLEKRVLEYLEQKGETSVQSLYEALTVADSSITRPELADTVCNLSETDRVTLEQSSVKGSFLRYLSVWEFNLDVYGVLALAFIAILSIYGLPAVLPWVALRWVLGIILILFVPGYVAIKAVFPRSRMDPFERLGLSVGMSLVLAIFVGVILNFSPLAIKLDPIVAVSTILTVGFAFVALARGHLGR